MKKFKIAYDFDGVLHMYDGWRDGTIYGEPVPGAIEALKDHKSRGWEQTCFTCRTPLGDVFWWIRDRFGLDIPVTGEKPHADIYIDDRGLRFDGDWSRTRLLLEAMERNNFKTWTGDDKRTSPGAQDAIAKLGW